MMKYIQWHNRWSVGQPFALLIILIIIQQHIVGTYGLTFLDQEDDGAEFPCVINSSTKIDELSDNCKLLKLYNQTQVDMLHYTGGLSNVTVHCACELANMQDSWRKAFDMGTDVRRLAITVEQQIAKDQATGKQPVYLFSDIDVTVYKISIHTAASDFFDQQAHNKSMALRPSVRRHLESDELWSLTRRVCRLVAQDQFKVYRYLENLNRADPAVFFKLVNYAERVEIVYQASKACKLLLLLKFNDYKLKPDNSEIVPVELEPTLENPIDSQNAITTDIDTMLKDASALLLNCAYWQREKSSLQDLARDCPMMMSQDKVPTDWLQKHPSSLDRSQVAIKCGCQLLLHNSTWKVLIEDPNISVMSVALTKYMNLNRVPDFANTPIWSIYGWFNRIMDRFIKNKKMSIKEIVKIRTNEQDPTVVINQGTRDYAQSLELLRRGCNLLVFNHRKGSKQPSELKLIKYLDNLQLISQDPMFVFHLSLQDVNLFKLHAVSKMCQPVIK